VAADNDSDYRIRIRTVADGDGAAKSIADLKQVEAATEGVTASTETMGKVGEDAARSLSNLRGIHHALFGIQELAEGGTAAIGGMAAEGRVAVEVFESMLGPRAPIALAITTITMLAAPMIAKWQEHAQKISDAKDNTDDLTKATDNYKESLDASLESQKSIEESEKRQLGLIHDRQAAEKEVIELRKQGAMAEAQARYLEKNNAAKTAEDRKRAKEEYDAEVADIKSQSEVATANLAVKNKQEDIAQSQKDLESIRADQSGNKAELQRAQDAGASGRNLLALDRVTMGKDGDLTTKDNSGKDVPVDELFQKMIGGAMATLKGLQENSGHFMKAEDERANQAEIDRVQGIIESGRQELHNIHVASQDAQAYPEAQKKYGPTIADQEKRISELEDQLAKQQGELPAAQQGLAVAQTSARQDTEQRGQTQSQQDRDDAVKKRRQQRDDELEARHLLLEGDAAKNPDLPTGDKAKNDQAMAQVEIEKLKNQRVDAWEDGTLTAALNDKINAEITKILDEVAGKVVKQGDTEKRTGTRDAQKQIEEESGKVEAYGGGALHEEAMAKLRFIRDTMKEDPDAELHAIVEEMAELLQGHVSAMAGFVPKVKSQLDQVRQNHNQLEHTMGELSNSNVNL
jgi:hypothetical protein